MANKKKSQKRKRSATEKVVIVLGIIIALSMILSLFVGLGRGGSSSSTSGSDSQGSLPVGPSVVMGAGALVRGLMGNQPGQAGSPAFAVMAIGPPAV
jgi:hypothetical protein